MIEGWIVVCILVAMLLSFTGAFWAGYIMGTSRRMAENSLDAALLSLPEPTSDTFRVTADELETMWNDAQEQVKNEVEPQTLSGIIRDPKTGRFVKPVK